MGPSRPPARLGLAWIPVAQVEPLAGSSLRLLEALGGSGGRPVLVFTSPRTPGLLIEDAVAHGVIDRLLDAVSRARIAVVGGATARSVERLLHAKPALVPGEESTRGLAALLAGLAGDSRIVAVRAAGVPRLDVPVDYVEVHAYRIVYSRENSMLAAEVLNRGLAGPGLFTSPGIAASVAGMLDPHVTVLAIGEPTARVLRSYGFTPRTPEKPRIGLLASLAREECTGT